MLYYIHIMRLYICYIHMIRYLNIFIINSYYTIIYILYSYSTCNRWIRCIIDEYDADKIIGLFCKRALLKRLYSAKETYDLIDPTHRSHPIISKYLSKAYFVVVSINLYHAYLCAHPVSKYSRLQIGWHWISRWLWKRFQRTRILPMGVTISTK